MMDVFRQGMEKREAQDAITLERWDSSPEKHLTDRKVAEAISRELSEGDIRNILTARVEKGHRIRPFLVFLMNDKKIDTDTLASIGAAIELFHQATLIYDDTIDEHANRDGNRTSIHSMFGNRIESAGIADHLATFLLVTSDRSIHELAIEDSKKLRIASHSALMKQRMFIAQLADKLIHQKPTHMGWTEWCLQHSYYKTSGLMAFPFVITGIVRDVSDEQQEQLERCGEALGRIYQICDDLQDLRDPPPPGPLALSYPLAILLDHPEELDAESYRVLEKVTKQREVLATDVEAINWIFQDKSAYLLAMGDREISNQTAALSLPEGVSGMVEIDTLVRHAKDASYWSYTDTVRS